METLVPGTRSIRIRVCDHCQCSVRLVGHAVKGGGPLWIYRYGSRHYCLDCVALGYGQLKPEGYDAPWPDNSQT